MGHNYVGHWVIAIGHRSLSSYGSYVGHWVIAIGHRSLSS